MRKRVLHRKPYSVSTCDTNNWGQSKIMAHYSLSDILVSLLNLNLIKSEVAPSVD